MFVSRSILNALTVMCFTIAFANLCKFYCRLSQSELYFCSQTVLHKTCMAKGCLVYPYGAFVSSRLRIKTILGLFVRNYYISRSSLQTHCLNIRSCSSTRQTTQGVYILYPRGLAIFTLFSTFHFIVQGVYIVHPMMLSISTSYLI